MIFITGVNGSGKSTLIPFLKEIAESKMVHVHDLDERGVPDNANRKWRLEETNYWLNIGKENANQGIETIICGFARPSEISRMSHEITAKFVLLDLSADVLIQRLEKRNADVAVAKDLERATGQSVDELIQNNISFLPILRKECKESDCLVVNTDNLKPREIAEKISKDLLLSGTKF